MILDEQTGMPLTLTEYAKRAMFAARAGASLFPSPPHLPLCTDSPCSFFLRVSRLQRWSGVLHPSSAANLTTRHRSSVARAVRSASSSSSFRAHLLPHLHLSHSWQLPAQKIVSPISPDALRLIAHASASQRTTRLVPITLLNVRSHLSSIPLSLRVGNLFPLLVTHTHFATCAGAVREFQRSHPPLFPLTHPFCARRLRRSR